MAMESACKLQVGKDHYDGRVRMEGDHIDFAGPTKFRFRLGEIRNPRREEDAILFGFHGNPVSIRLGSMDVAEDWIDYILHPQTLADKLGVKEGHTVRVLNLDDGELLDSLETKQTNVVSQPVNQCDLVMLGVERASELRQIEDLNETLRPDGAIWVVLPKTVRTVTKANVFAAARQAGLDQTEVIDYSETQAAYKIVRPRASGKPADSSPRPDTVKAK
ncbi:MAG: DUF3052 family protein [Phycisphaerae bacterium]|nr:DUF3052 family protein [Phycisphaerae bacterium]